jgi:cell division septum initiation protein DivIVA
MLAAPKQAGITMSDDSSLPAGVSPTAVFSARQRAADKVLKARTTSDQKVMQAQQAAKRSIDSATAQAAMIVSAVQTFYFNQRMSLSCWAPKASASVSKIQGSGSVISDISFDDNLKQVFWASKLSNKIWTSSVGENGASPLRLYNTQAPQSLAIDTKAQQIFWPSNSAKIMRGSFSAGDTPQQVLILEPSNYCDLSNMKIAGGRCSSDKFHLFWADGQSIYKFDTTQAQNNPENIFSAPSAMPYFASCDDVNKYIYWVDFNYHQICRCNFDGEDFSKLFNIANPGSVYGLAIDGLSSDVFTIEQPEGLQTYWLTQYKAATSNLKLLKIGLQPNGSGLALHLSETNKALREAITANRLEIEKSEQDIIAARQTAETLVYQAQDLLMGSEAKAQQTIEKAHQDGDKLIQNEEQKRQAAIVDSQQKINAANTLKAQQIAQAQSRANAIISDAKTNAKAKIDTANQKLKNAREDQRQHGL